MNEVRAVRQGRMNAGDDEGWGGHPAPHAHGGAHALSEGGLARSKITGEHDEVTRSQQDGQTAAQGPGRLGVGGLDHHLAALLIQIIRGLAGHHSS